ncbi:hypothetical protein CYMTET_33367 [Cymbomonas tetramitiformis]|uniref:SET domain-containing protein n=1 Tax=Cymbomonas tetramitiformis TaxID=36881 RepID=A0AAE0FDD8_9CHLO|nr:hypothetical protein CYMTET_33367 [Cymbomonas tetramitiformis]
MSVFEHPALEVTQFVGKGRGFRATDRIPAGTVILQEKPWQNSNVGSPAPGVLSPSTKESVVSFILHSPSASALSYTPSAYRHEKSSINGVSDLAYSEAAAKARTNMFLTDGGFIVLFDRLSIFNHECSPNSCYHQQFVSTGPTTAAGTEATVVGTIMTIRDVDPGEELTIAYNPQALMVLRELRKEFLKNTHGFPCSCRRCTEPMGISTPDGILTRMSPSFEGKLASPCRLPRFDTVLMVDFVGSPAWSMGMPSGNDPGYGDLGCKLVRDGSPACEAAGRLGLRCCLRRVPGGLGCSPARTPAAVDWEAC